MMREGLFDIRLRIPNSDGVTHMLCSSRRMVKEKQHSISESKGRRGLLSEQVVNMAL